MSLFSNFHQFPTCPFTISDSNSSQKGSSLYRGTSSPNGPPRRPSAKFQDKRRLIQQDASTSSDGQTSYEQSQNNDTHLQNNVFAHSNLARGEGLISGGQNTSHSITSNLFESASPINNDHDSTEHNSLENTTAANSKLKTMENNSGASKTEYVSNDVDPMHPRIPINSEIDPNVPLSNTIPGNTMYQFHGQYDVVSYVDYARVYEPYGPSYDERNYSIIQDGSTSGEPAKSSMSELDDLRDQQTLDGSPYDVNKAFQAPYSSYYTTSSSIMKPKLEDEGGNGQDLSRHTKRPRNRSLSENLLQGDGILPLGHSALALGLQHQQHSTGVQAPGSSSSVSLGGMPGPIMHQHGAQSSSHTPRNQISPTPPFSFHRQSELPDMFPASGDSMKSRRPPAKAMAWTREEELKLKNLVSTGKKWPDIVTVFPLRSAGAVKKHYYADMKHIIWTPEEDAVLQEAYEEDKRQRWKRISDKVKRSPKLCEKRMKELMRMNSNPNPQQQGQSSESMSSTGRLDELGEDSPSQDTQVQQLQSL